MKRIKYFISYRIVTADADSVDFKNLVMSLNKKIEDTSDILQIEKKISTKQIYNNIPSVTILFFKELK